MTQCPTLIKQIRNRSENGIPFFRPILMQFAAQQIGHSYRDFYLNHEVLVAANLTCQSEFGMDAVGLISDPYRESSAFGVELDYPQDSVPRPRAALIRTLENISTLQIPDIMQAKRTRDRIDGVRLFRQKLDADVPVIGWIEGPLAEACTLTGVKQMMSWLRKEPQASDEILQKMVPVAKAFAQAQILAGANIIGIGDAICSQISPAMYVRFVKHLHAEIIQFIQEQDAMVKLHICGDITHLLPHLAELKPDIVDLDWMVNMEQAFQILGPDIIRSGNLDPAGVIVSQSANTIYTVARELVLAERGRAFILAGGCEISPLTPPENLKAMQAAARN